MRLSPNTVSYGEQCVCLTRRKISCRKQCYKCGLSFPRVSFQFNSTICFTRGPLNRKQARNSIYNHANTIHVYISPTGALPQKHIAHSPLFGRVVLVLPFQTAGSHSGQKLFSLPPSKLVLLHCSPLILCCCCNHLAWKELGPVIVLMRPPFNVGQSTLGGKYVATLTTSIIRHNI